MAPLDPDSTARSNILPVSLFAGQILLVVGLTANVLLTARRAAKSLPPATATRAQEPFRREQTILFSCIAFASLFFVTFFAFAWRALSYLQWAHSHGHEAPNTLWSGREGVGNWRLGDWLSDVNLVTESDAATVAKPEAFLYTTEHFVGLLAASIFMGVEGRRRNLSNSTVASFVLLSTTGSLGYALSLFFVTMLYTPLSIHSARTRRHDTLFTPKPAVLYIPVILSIFGIYKLPSMLKLSEDVLFVRSSYVLVPLFLAFAPQIIPASWGQHHTSKPSAHRSFTTVFWVLSLASFALHWNMLTYAVLVNTPTEHSAIYEFFAKYVNRNSSKSGRFLNGLITTARNLKLIGVHPAMNVTTYDIIFTTISLLAWTLLRDLDISTILDNSVLWLLQSSKPEKHVAFDSDIKRVVEEVYESDSAAPPVTPRRRGRPRKSTLTNGASTAVPSTSTLRKSSRKTRTDYESEGEEAYEPSAAVKQEIAQTETDGTPSDDVGGGESTAVAIALFFLGGLGQLCTGVLGAEVTGTNE